MNWIIENIGALFTTYIGAIIVFLCIAFLIKLMMINFWTSIITDIVTKKLEARYGIKHEKIIGIFADKQEEETN